MLLDAIYLYHLHAVIVSNYSIRGLPSLLRWWQHCPEDRGNISLKLDSAEQFTVSSFTST